MTRGALLCAALAAAVTGGCTFVQTGQPTTTNVSGDAWYTKDRHILFLPVGGDIYYCPKETPTRCQAAEIVE
ncbi:MAG: hypothetical protein IT376_04550 [Polyangiaceae bacterium]|nr:hypothetical protein [Polyangiaceae bacterium]